MDVQEQFSRARFATLIVGTKMLQLIFDKLKDDFCVHAKIKEILKVKDFQPFSMNFMDLYDICTKGLVKKLHPSTNWNDAFVYPQDVLLGDDIKRIKKLLHIFSETESELLDYKKMHDDICKTLNDIIKRFFISEKEDFSKIFQDIMHRFIIEEINADLEIILCKGISAHILQKYTTAPAKSEACRNRKQNEKPLYSRHHVNVTEKERPSKSKRMKTTTSNVPIDAFPECDSHWQKKMTAMKENMPPRKATEIKDEGKLRSSSEKISTKRFIKKQIFFDFVPPPLNYFEYTMNELCNIEKSLNRVTKPDCLEPSVSKYMSFLFVYGNHMNVTQASLALFDAEPEEKEDNDNKSGINVVYFDKDMTFEMLEEITCNQSLPVLSSGEYVCLAVHSDQLLQDRTKLRKMMKQLAGRRLEVLDANCDMKRLYDKFTKLSIRVIKIVESVCEDAKERVKNLTNLPDLKERLSELQQLNNPLEGNKIPTLKTKKALSRLKEKGLLGYTTENNTLILCVKSSPNSLTKDRIPKIIKDEFKSIKINKMEQLFTFHCGITSGEKLHPQKDNVSSYGTIGMIGSFHSIRERNPTRCCISSPHVISKDQVAYFMDAKKKLGKCIWPPRVPNYHINVQDISIIPLEENDIKISTEEGMINIFKETNRDSLDRRKVFKYGATTGRTDGIVCKTNFYLPIKDPPISVFLIEPRNEAKEKPTFSEPGDSGAVVLTKFGQRVHAFSMIFGGDVNIEGVAKNNSIAVELKYAVNHFEMTNDKILELDTL